MHMGGDISNSEEGGFQAEGGERISGRMTWEDLCFIAEHNLGLRHVSSQKRLEEERSNGIAWGDALAICRVADLIDIADLPSTVIGQKAERAKEFLPLRLLGVALSEEAKLKLANRFQAEINRFIEDSVGIDINELEGNIVDERLVLHGQLESSFVIASWSYGCSWDKRSYYGLGKFGKGTIAPDKVVGGFSILDVTTDGDLPSEGAVLDKNDFNSVKQRLGGLLLDRFTEEINRLRETGNN